MNEGLVRIRLRSVRTDLSAEAESPNTIEERVSPNTTENVSFAVKFSRVDFVEQGHQNKSVENHRKLFTQFSYGARLLLDFVHGRFEVEKMLASVENDEHHN